MLTRAYDAIMMAYTSPMITISGQGMYSTTLNDQYMNYKDGTGTVRNVMHTWYMNASSISYTNASLPSYTTLPFAYFSVTPSSQGTFFYPDEDSSTPSYEDYTCITTAMPTGWKVATSNLLGAITTSYDASTGEFVSSVTMMFQNTSSSAKTVYGIRVRGTTYYRSSETATTVSSTYLSYPLLCREKLPSPISVAPNGIISLTFTWRVGRAGKIQSTSVS